MGVTGILGIKLGMTQFFAEDGSSVPCTVLQAGPCVVVQRRNQEKDGYDAVQLGLVEFIKPQRLTKAMTGHFKKSGVAPMRFVREIRLEESKDETNLSRDGEFFCSREGGGTPKKNLRCHCEEPSKMSSRGTASAAKRVEAGRSNLAGASYKLGCSGPARLDSAS